MIPNSANPQQSLTAALSNRLSRARSRGTDFEGYNNDIKQAGKQDNSTFKSEFNKAQTKRDRIDRSSEAGMKKTQNDQGSKDDIDSKLEKATKRSRQPADNAAQAAGAMMTIVPQETASPAADANQPNGTTPVNAQLAEQIPQNVNILDDAQQIAQQLQSQSEQSASLRDQQAEQAVSGNNPAAGNDPASMVTAFKLESAAPHSQAVTEEPTQDANAIAQEAPVIQDAQVAAATIDRQAENGGDKQDGQAKGELKKQIEAAQPPANQATAFNAEAQIVQGPVQSTAASQEAAPKEPVATQLVQKIAMESTAGNQKFTLELKPEALGKVQIELSMGQDGLTAKIKTADPATRAAIAGEIAQLQEGLKEKGIQVVTMEIIYDQNMQDLTQQNFAKQNGNGNGERRHNVISLPQTMTSDAPLEALTASSMYDTASVEYRA